MNDFEPVAFLENRAGPVGAAHDFVIKLNGKAFGREAEVFDKFRQSYLVGHVAGFAVNLYEQDCSPPFLAGCRENFQA